MKRIRKNCALVPIIIYVLLLSPVSIQAASFDCEIAQSNIEHQICDDSYLSGLDVKLDKAYQDVLRKSSNERIQSIINEQKHWLKFTRNVCESETCLKHAYWSRLAALEAYFEPRFSPLYEHESEKAEMISKLLFNEPFYLHYETPFCNQIFDDLKHAKNVRFVDPVVQTQSYEDPALDPWKAQCQTAPPFNLSYNCGRYFTTGDADHVINTCGASYGLPPFKLYELPPVDSQSEKRYIFYSDDAYGPMNRDWKKAHLGGGFSGYQQIHISRCLSAMGNRWENGGKKLTSWKSRLADAGLGTRNGENYNSIIEYQDKYYFLILNKKYGVYYFNIQPIEIEDPPVNFCRWTPTKH